MHSMQLIVLAIISAVMMFGNGVDAADCSAAGKLTLQYLNETTKDNKKISCMDGTPAGYYIDFPTTYEYTNAEEVIEKVPKPISNPPPQNRKFILWFGEGDLCSGEDCSDYCDTSVDREGGVCEGIPAEIDPSDISDEEALCFLRRFTCSSDEWKRIKRVTPETILCHQDPVFGEFTRVFVPMCTLDWFLGTGDYHGDRLTPDPESTRFRGANLLKGFFEEMIRKYDIQLADTVIIGGTFGGAIGVLNNIKRIRSWLVSINNLLIVSDSAYFFDFEGFSVRSENASEIYVVDNLMKNKTRDWLEGASVDPECKAFWGAEKHRCLVASVLVPNFLSTEKIFFMQSQYDLLVFSQLGILTDEKRSHFVDLPSYAYALVSYIESWGAGIRSSIIDAAALTNATSNSTGFHTYFSTGCPQHGYVAPTRYHSIKKQTRDVGSAGSLEFERGPDVWDTVKVGNVVLHKALQQWVQGSGAVLPIGQNEASESFPYNVRGDTCGSFLCNPTCTSAVFPFRLKPVWPGCMQNMVLAFAIIMVLFMWGAFCMSYMNVRRFRDISGSYWKKVQLSQPASGPSAGYGQKMISMQLGSEAEAGNRSSAASSSPDVFINPAYQHSSRNLDAVDGEKKNAADEYADAQEQLLREAAESEYRKVHLMVRDLCYWAPGTKGRSKFQILRNVNLAFTPGTMHALMGPSGSGKSTLLDVMALIRDTGEISGNHYINGVESHKTEAIFLREWLRNNVSYVRQTDVLFPLITVREHLTHAAWLMLPEYMNPERKLKRVWQVIKLLELERCADTICGDGGVKIEGGISGGQRRRVSVAAQLLRLPAAMLLDEPTSGLDSTSALTLVRALSTLAHRGGVNIAMTIHQPRQEIFELFDALTILVSGKIVYSGTPKGSAPHFGVSPSEKNISNEILDHLSKVGPDKVDEYKTRYETGPLGKAMTDMMDRETTIFTKDMAADLQAVLLENALAEGRWSWSSPTSAPTQAWVLLSRTILRGGFAVHKTAILAIIGGVVVGLCFFGIGTFTSKTALCYLSVTTMTFLQGTFLGDRYLAEKEMYDHEANAGSSTSWQAFLGNQFIRDSVTSAIEGLSFGIPCYWIGGMNPDLERFQLFLIIVILLSLNCISQNVFVEVWMDNLRKAALVNVSLVGLGALFNGFIIRLYDLPVYFSWIPYVMITYWGFVAVLINDFAGFVFEGAIDNETATALEKATQSGDVVVHSLSYSDRDVNIAIFAITCMIVGLRCLACLVFYRQYVFGRGNQMKRVSGGEGDSITDEYTQMSNQINQAKNALVNKVTSMATSGAVAGSAMQSMLANKADNAKTALKEKKKEARAANATPGSPDGVEYMKQESFASSGSGVNGSSNNLNASPAGEGKDFVFHNEWENYNEEEATSGLNEKYGRIKSLLLSRVAVMILFFIDLALGSVACFVTKADIVLYIYYALNAIFLLIFAAQFSVSILGYIPFTPDGYLDCIWNGFRDSICAVATLGDAVLFVQTFISAPFSVPDRDDSNLLLVFAFGMRATRLLRAIIFWGKVSRYHLVRAKHWLKWNDEYQTLKRLEAAGVDITKLASGSPKEGEGNPSFPQISSFNLAGSMGKPAVPRRSLVSSMPGFRPPSTGRSGRPMSERLRAAGLSPMSAAAGGVPAHIPPRPDFGSAWSAYKPEIPPR